LNKMKNSVLTETWWMV